jgi:hypothetical protein
MPSGVLLGRDLGNSQRVFLDRFDRGLFSYNARPWW